MVAPFIVVFACDAVEELCDRMRSHRNFCMVSGDELYAATKAMTWDGHRFYVHVYYDSYKAALDEKTFGHTLYCYMEEILSGKRVKEHSAYYEKFFFIRETSVRGIRTEYNEESIARHKCNHIGWFVLATNDIKDKVYVLEVHRNKDSAGKWFDELKNDLDMKRLRIHTTATMEGRAFLQFTALLITTRLKQVMAEAGWFKNYNLQPQRIYYGIDPFSKKIFE